MFPLPQILLTSLPIQLHVLSLSKQRKKIKTTNSNTRNAKIKQNEIQSPQRNKQINRKSQSSSCVGQLLLGMGPVPECG